MTVSEMFQGLLENIKIDNASQISQRYEEITSSLNKKFRDTDSKTANSLQVGSYGRWTAIKGISDLDMLYIMPKGKWDRYKNDQSKLLRDTKEAIQERYPTTNIRVDRLVVTAIYTNFQVEIQPVFEQEDGSFKYPDTYNGGSWKVTKPRDEIQAMKEFDNQKNKNLRRLCKMARAWKNKHQVAMGGLLIDTLAYNFLKSNNDFDDKSFLYYDRMCRDFFQYLMEQPDQDHYKALGSGQNVKVKKRFQSKAKTAYNLCCKAIDANGSEAVNDKWKKVFGRPFPSKPKKSGFLEAFLADQDWDNTEEFIEDFYPVDIRFELKIDCDVYRNQSRSLLSMILSGGHKISSNKKLIFKIKECAAPEPYIVKWKVLNIGPVAEDKNCIRGEIIDSNESNNRRKETADFTGDHIVECYIIVNGVVVAADSIKVPIL